MLWCKSRPDVALVILHVHARNLCARNNHFASCAVYIYNLTGMINMDSQKKKERFSLKQTHKHFKVNLIKSYLGTRGLSRALISLILRASPGQ